jgi:hypothetical protein
LQTAAAKPSAPKILHGAGREFHLTSKHEYYQIKQVSLYKKNSELLHVPGRPQNNILKVGGHFDTIKV